MSNYTHGDHCIHLADWCELEGQLCRTRRLLRDLVRDLDDLSHAVTHRDELVEPDTIDNLIRQAQSRLRRGADDITSTLDTPPA